jgi:hypothetical protein
MKNIIDLIKAGGVIGIYGFALWLIPFFYLVIKRPPLWDKNDPGKLSTAFYFIVAGGLILFVLHILNNK